MSLLMRMEYHAVMDEYHSRIAVAQRKSLMRGATEQAESILPGRFHMRKGYKESSLFTALRKLGCARYEVSIGQSQTSQLELELGAFPDTVRQCDESNGWMGKERDASTWWIQYAALEARLVGIGVGTLVFCCLFATKPSLPREKGKCKDHSLSWSAEIRNILPRL